MCISILNINPEFLQKSLMHDTELITLTAVGLRFYKSSLHLPQVSFDRKLALRSSHQ